HFIQVQERPWPILDRHSPSAKKNAQGKKSSRKKCRSGHRRSCRKTILAPPAKEIPRSPTMKKAIPRAWVSTTSKGGCQTVVTSSLPSVARKALSGDILILTLIGHGWFVVCVRSELPI